MMKESVMMSSRATQPVPISVPIAQEFESLFKAIEDLGQHVSSMEDRLSPVLSKVAEPARELEARKQPGCESDLRTAVMMAQDRVRIVGDRVRVIQERIDL